MVGRYRRSSPETAGRAALPVGADSDEPAPYLGIPASGGAVAGPLIHPPATDLVDGSHPPAMPGHL
jgi:hypothetical protein